MIPLHRNCSCQCFSHSRIVLLLLSNVSFGAHFARNALPVIGGLYLIEEGFISPSGLGVLLAISSLPSTFLPLMTGLIADKSHSMHGLMCVFLALTVMGQALLVASLSARSFPLACIALVVFGCGGASITSFQRSMVAMYLPDNQTFGIAMCVAVAHLSKIAGKLYVVPLTGLLGSLTAATMLNVVACLFSMVVFLALLHHLGDSLIVHAPVRTESANISRTENAEQYYQSVPMDEREDGDRISSAVEGEDLSDFEGCGLAQKIRLIPFEIYVLIFIHALYVVVFHVLLNFLPHYGVVTWKVSKQMAVVVSCIPSIVIMIYAPILGILADKMRRPKIIFAVAALLLATTFQLFVVQGISASVAVFLLTILNSTLTTLSLALISKSAPLPMVATIFGMIEVVDSIGNILGNVAFGYLFDATGSYHVPMIVISIIYWGTVAPAFFLYACCQ